MNDEQKDKKKKTKIEYKKHITRDIIIVSFIDR